MFIPPICLIVYRKMRCVGKGLQKSPLPQIEHQSEKMVIIGNGPSLNDSVKKYKEEILKSDRIAVNFFASTDLYEEVKPNIYLFADPAYFNVPKRLESSIEKLFFDIIEKTTWQMHMIIPFSAHDAKLLKTLNKNKNIKLDFYFNGYQNIGNLTKFEAWDKNLIVPPSQNVLNVALYLSLYWGYKETYLIGADSSFFEDLRIDQDTNELFSLDKHFYEGVKGAHDNKQIGTTTRKQVDGWTLHDLIFAYGKMFEGYYELNQYADYKGLHVYNASEYSWINVFKRKKLK